MTSGGTPPPTPMKKQKARPPRPPSLQPLPPLPCLSPRGGAWNDRWPLGRGGGGPRGLAQWCYHSPFPNQLPSSGRGKRTRDAGDGEGLGLSTPPTPPPSGPVLSPRRWPATPGRAGGRTGGRERGKEGGTVEVPAPRPQRHLPSATYRGSSNSQGRGQSSSERSVRPTVPLKGAGVNQRAPEESAGIAPVRRTPLSRQRRLEPRVVSLSRSFLDSAVVNKPGSSIQK